MILHPTGHCFDDALDYITLRLKADREAWPRLYLVHLIALHPDPPKLDEPFAHAWVEEWMGPALGDVSVGDAGAPVIVWQGAILNGDRVFYSADRAEVLEKLRVQDFTRYTLKEALKENARTRTFGPWLEKYRALCRQSRTTNGAISDDD